LTSTPSPLKLWRQQRGACKRSSDYFLVFRVSLSLLNQNREFDPFPPTPAEVWIEAITPGPEALPGLQEGEPLWRAQRPKRQLLLPGASGPFGKLEAKRRGGAEDDEFESALAEMAPDHLGYPGLAG
jgi:hypothetical protein